MAKAHAAEGIFPDVMLEMNFDEAKALLLTLGKINATSEINTFAVYDALADALDDYTSAYEQISLTQADIDDLGHVQIWQEPLDTEQLGLLD